jgi:3-(3-hydroxy-phenyl)propionate hydroxylase
MMRPPAATRADSAKMASYQYAHFPYVEPPELGGAASRRRPVIIVGAGPVGLTAAIDLALHDIAVLVLDESDVVSVGSRAICWAKRTLEIWHRLGVAERMLAKGVTWNLGRVYHRDQELYSFNLAPEGGHKMPAFINLQQYYVEEFLIARASELANRIELRWKNKVTGISSGAGGVELEVETPDGCYRLEADWVIAADGGRSSIRGMLGLPFPGEVFEERFLIADVHMQAEFPNERWFWFEPTFHQGESALLHRQPDDVFRLDFQLGPSADPELERRPERVLPRIRAVVGETPFELEWSSVYAFRCARMDRFVHGRVIFAGDSAHLVSPFGARGGNGGIQDADNLCWKLASVVKGEARASLLDSYDEERGRGADENILNSTRTTNFMTPKTAAERLFRDNILALARAFPFARSLVNAGRLSKPCSLEALSLQGDDEQLGGAMVPGAPCADAPIVDAGGRPGWLLEHLGGDFTLLVLADASAEMPDRSALAGIEPAPGLCLVSRNGLQDCKNPMLFDPEGLVHARYGGPGAVYLVRPDQHVAARFHSFDGAAIRRALLRACGNAA